MKACASARRRLREKRRARRALDDPAVMQERHLVGEPARLPQIVRDQHHARPLRPHGADQPLDGRGRRRDRGWRWARPGSGSPDPSPARGRSTAAAARRPTARGRATCARCASRARSSAACARSAALRPGHAGDGQRILDVGQRRAAQQHGPLKHEADLGRAAPIGGGAGPGHAARPSAQRDPPARARAGSCPRRSGRSAPACRCRRSRCRCHRGCAGRRARRRGPRRGSAGWRRRLARSGCDLELHPDLRHRPSGRPSPAGPSPAR